MGAPTIAESTDLTTLTSDTIHTDSNFVPPQEYNCLPAKATRATSPFVGSDLSEDNYRQITAILQQQQNFNLDGYKVLCIKRRLAVRIRAAGYNCPEAYIELLREDPHEQEQLLTTLSIHVSEFFRNPSVFSVLEKTILPELFATTRKLGSKMRIWCVGCANGEEPYSLALLCRQQHNNDAISIIATDLSSAALVRAKKGIFSAERLRNLPGELLTDYFSRHNGQYQLDRKVREQVQFFRHDILSDQPFYRADLILCRNLLIYFSRQQQQKILELLAAALLPGGYLILGRAETLAPKCRELFFCVDPAERIYQRRN